MPIAPPPAPDNIAQIAMDEAGRARTLKPSATVAGALLDVGGGAPVQAAAAKPLPVYTIPIERLADSDTSSVEEAQQHGWRVRTVDTAGEQLVDIAKEGEPTAVRRGVSAEILLRAASVAGERVDPETSYEARVLDFGQLGLSALWLHDDGGPDRFFSLDKEPRERDEHDLIAEAERRARRFLDKPAAMDGPEGLADLGG